MVEVMVSVAVLAIVALPLLNMFANTTAQVVYTNKKAQDTYVAKAQMESLYNQNLSQLFTTADLSTKKSSGSPVLNGSDLVKTPIADAVAGSGKFVTVSAVPTGNLDKSLWSNDANPPVYAYLIVTKSNTFNAKFVGPEGLITSISDVSSLDDAVFDTSTSGTTYTLKKATGNTTILSGVKPANRPLVLVINSVSVVNTKSASDTTFMFYVSGSMFVQHYKPVSMLVQGYRNNFVVSVKSGTIPVSVYSNDNTTPTTIPVNVTCSVYPKVTTPITSPDSTTTNTLEVYIGT